MNRTEAERLAKMANGLRPDWPWNSLVTFIETHLAERSYRDAAVALAYVACEPDTRTPRRVLEAGPWWNVGPASARPTESCIVTYCEHGDPGATCRTCHPPREHAGVAPTPEQRAAMRAAITQARTDTQEKP